MPFCNTFERDIHFLRHGSEFSAATAEEYERMADEFAFGSVRSGTKECVRPNMIDGIRFDFLTHNFSVCRLAPGDPCLRTFYVVRNITVANHQGEAGYFTFECNRINL
jgi:hypothetical protein